MCVCVRERESYGGANSNGALEPEAPKSPNMNILPVGIITNVALTLLKSHSNTAVHTCQQLS